MPERIEWLDDGTAGGSPFSPRFGDRYRSELGGLEQAREVFLKGCGLPDAWAGQPQWTVLETGFGLGLNFLVTWQAWSNDPARPQRLHFVSTEAFPASPADVLRGAASHPELMPLAQQLHDQLWGLLPGIHRLSLEGGRVLLTLCIGDTKAVLREQAFEADSVYLDGFSPQRNPDIWDIHTFKAVARCCRRGARIATWTIARSVRDALTQCGFVVQKVPGIPPKRDNLQGEYNPGWQPKPARGVMPQRSAGRCVVIGAGLAGAGVAASLARRGWQVCVLDAGDGPATGASGLPAGVLAPHVSPDDAPLSRLSRSGVRITLQQAHALLEPGTDWAPTGVLEHGVALQRRTPASWQGDWAQAGADWSSPATAEQLHASGLPATAHALWHAPGGWIRPAALVAAWLNTPGVRCQTGAAAHRLANASGLWHVLDSSGRELAQGEIVVLAAGPGSLALAAAAEPACSAPLALQPIRGQVSWGLMDGDASAALPPFPINGNGSLIGGVPLAGVNAWVTGATFDKDNAAADVHEEDHAQNLQRLQSLLPAAAEALSPAFSVGKVKAWAGVRCATPTRLPMLGELDAAGLWVASGMGSRGLSFAALCGELLAARLHGEPLPLAWRLAEALQPQRSSAKKSDQISL